MDSTLRWTKTHSIFCVCKWIPRVLVASVMLTWCMAPMASVVSWAPDFLAATAMQTQAQFDSEEEPYEVESQSKYLFNLAKKEIREGNKERAKFLLQRVLVLDPQHENAKKQLVEITKDGGSLRPNTIASNNPDEESLTASEMVELAQAKINDKDFDGAKETLEKAVEIAETDEIAQTAKALLRTIDVRKQQSQKNEETQMQYRLDQLDQQIQKGIIYLENEQYDRAEEELQRAKQMAPDDERVNKLLDRVYKNRDNKQKDATARELAAQKQEDSGKKQVADTLFQEGVDLYEQGQVIDAVTKWNQAVETYPAHQYANTYLTNTRREYEKAVEEKEKAEELSAQEQEYEEMLDEQIVQYSTQGEEVDIKNVISTVVNLTKLNVVIDDDVSGDVTIEKKDTSLRKILNSLSKQYGIKWQREEDTIYVDTAYQTRVFDLTEEQYKTLELILDDPSTLEDSSRNLKTILYGPQAEFDTPGKDLYLNERSQSLLVTDTEENIRKVEAFLKEMPEIVDEKKPVVVRTFSLDRDIASDIYEIVKLTLFQDQGSYDVRDERRQLYLEPNSSTMIVIDYPENIETVEDILANQSIQDQLERGDLMAKRFQITDLDDVESTPEALARRTEFVETVANVIEKMLFSKSREEAILQGRMVQANPEMGTIDVVDTRENIRRVEDYLNSVRGETTQDILIEAFKVQHVDVYTIADALGYLFYDSQQSTRSLFISESNFQSIGSSQDADVGQNVGNFTEETTRNRFNLTGGGGGGTDMIQFFDVRFFPDENTNSIIVFTTSQEVLSLINRVLNTYDKPQRMVEIENRVVSVALDDLRAINFDYILTNPFLDKMSLNPENLDMGVDLIEGNSTDDPGLKFNMATIGESRLEFVMNLLESTSSLNVMSAPKILHTPNPLFAPVFFSGDQIPFADDVTFEDQGDDDPTNNRLVVNYDVTQVGTVLGFIPFILNDDHVYLEMQTNITEMEGRLPVNVTGGDMPPGQSVPDVGPLLLAQSYANYAVRVKSGETIVIGGMIKETETESQNRIPVISKIPFLGNLFKDRNINKMKSSILIFVTARIINPEY